MALAADLLAPRYCRREPAMAAWCIRHEIFDHEVAVGREGVSAATGGARRTKQAGTKATERIKDASA
jgi:hypothetical protein